MVLKILSGNEILTSIKSLTLLQNNYRATINREGSGSATINNVAHPKHPEEEETSPNKNHIITNLRNLTLYNPNLDTINVKYTKFGPLVLKILSGNEILRSIKGSNSVANLRIFLLYNPNLDTINVNVYTKFG